MNEKAVGATTFAYTRKMSFTYWKKIIYATLNDLFRHLDINLLFEYRNL